MVVASEVPSGTVLVLAPHPDDEVIGPGGVLNMHLQQQDPVTVLYLTDGRGSNASDTSLVSVRRQEARTLAAAHSFDQIFWDIPDTTLSDDPQPVQALVGVLGEIRPNYIYLPSFFEHQYDHFGANKLLAEALKRSDNSAVTIIGYEVWDNIAFPNYVVDITKIFDMKAAMMHMYETPMKATDFVTLCRHRNALHYSLLVSSQNQEAEGYAEAFYRLEGDHYINLFNLYGKTLQGHKSPIGHIPVSK